MVESIIEGFNQGRSFLQSDDRFPKPCALKYRLKNKSQNWPFFFEDSPAKTDIKGGKAETQAIAGAEIWSKKKNKVLDELSW